MSSSCNTHVPAWTQVSKDDQASPVLSVTTCCRKSQPDPGHPSPAQADWHFIIHLPFYSPLFRRLVGGVRSTGPWSASRSHTWGHSNGGGTSGMFALSELVDSDDGGAVRTRPLRDPGISRDPGIFSKSWSRDFQKSNPGIFQDFMKPLNDCIQRLSTLFIYYNNLFWDLWSLQEGKISLF